MANLDDFSFEGGLDEIYTENEVKSHQKEQVYDMQHPFPDIDEEDEYDEPVTKLLDPNPEKNQTESIPVSVRFLLAPTKNFFLS